MMSITMLLAFCAMLQEGFVKALSVTIVLNIAMFLCVSHSECKGIFIHASYRYEEKIEAYLWPCKIF